MTLPIIGSGPAPRFIDLTGQGADPTGAADSTAALNAALAIAAAAPGSRIHLPRGSYQFTSPGVSGFVVPSKTTISGDGIDATYITWNDSGASPPNLFCGPTSGRSSDVALRDFTVIGSWATNGNSTSGGGRPLNLSAIDGVHIANVGCDYSRQMSIVAYGCTAVEIDGCRVRYSGRDGINVTGSSGVSITNNVIAHCGDDGIAAHSDSAGDVETSRSRLLITGNRLFDSQGIKAISARKAMISGNQLDLIKGEGIAVETLSGQSEGASPTVAVTITGNTITNLIGLTAASPPSIGTGGGCPGIWISGTSAQKGTLNVVPGTNDTTTSTVPNPYAYILDNGSGAAVITDPSFGILVSGNQIMRTLPPCDGSVGGFTKPSDWGLCPNGLFTQTGWFNSSISLAAMQDYAVKISDGVVRDVLITGNMIHGLQGGVYFGNATRYDNIVVRGNQVTNYANDGVQLNTFGYSRIIIEDNHFDGDPFYTSANRTTVGGWTSMATPAPTGINAIRGAGLIISRNRFRNLYQVSNIDSTSLASGHTFDGNVAEAWPTTGGYAQANRGIGVAERDGGVMIAQTDAALPDGSWATSGGVVVAAGSIPTSGNWAPGRFIRNTAPVVANGRAVLGWLRLTYGASNVAGTDWQAIYGGTDAGFVISSSANSIIAAGSTQGTATALTAQINEVTGVATGSGVMLPLAVGAVITVINRAGNPLTVYPPPGAAIDNNAANAGVTVAALSVARFVALWSTQLFTV